MYAKWISWAILLTLVVTAALTGPKGGPTVDQEAPPFVAELLEGGRFDLSAHRGQVVLLDFWATWCPPCRRSLPAIEKLHQRYKNDPKVWIGTVNKEALSASALTTWLEKMRLDLPVIRDPHEEVSSLYHVRSIPMLVVINPKGRVTHAQAGLPNLSERGLVNHFSQLIEDARD